MFDSQFLRNSVLFVLMVLVCVGGIGCSEKPGDEMLALIPAESMAVIRINSFDNSLMQLDAYLAGVVPMPMGVSMAARAPIAQMLGHPALNGINTAGNFGACVIARPGKMEPAIRVLVPISDYAAFVSGNPNVGEPDANGVSKLVMNGQDIATVKQAGNYAVVTMGDGPVDINVEKGFETVIDTTEMALVTAKPAWAYVNVQKVNEVYGQVVTAQLQQAKMMMANMDVNMKAGLAALEGQRANLDANDPNNQAAITQLDSQIATMKARIAQYEKNPMKDSLGNIMEAYIRFFETFFNDTKSFSVAIEPQADILTIQETYTALPDSNTAKMLVADDSGVRADKLAGYLRDDAMINLAGRLNKPLLRKLHSEAIVMMGIMFAGKMSDEEIARMQQLSNEIIDSMGGTMVMSAWVEETAAMPFMENFAIEVSDGEKFNNSILKGIELWNKSEFMDFYRNMGMEMNYVTQANVYEYKGAKVNSSSLTFKATDPNSPESQIIEKMYGGGFEYRWAIVDGLCVGAMGTEPDPTVKEMIDQAKTGDPGMTPADITQAMAMLGSGADDVIATFNIVRLLKTASAMPMFPLQNITIESKSNIAFGGKITDGGIIGKFVIPKAHVIETMTAVMPKPPATTQP